MRRRTADAHPQRARQVHNHLVRGVLHHGGVRAWARARGHRCRRLWQRRDTFSPRSALVMGLPPIPSQPPSLPLRRCPHDTSAPPWPSHPHYRLHPSRLAPTLAPTPRPLGRAAGPLDHELVWREREREREGTRPPVTPLHCVAHRTINGNPLRLLHETLGIELKATAPPLPHEKAVYACAHSPLRAPPHRASGSRPHHAPHQAPVQLRQAHCGVGQALWHLHRASRRSLRRAVRVCRREAQGALTPPLSTVVQRVLGAAAPTAASDRGHAYFSRHVCSRA